MVKNMCADHDVPDHDSDTSPQASGRGRRRFGRVRQQGLYCNLGEIVDICADGVRIRTSHKVARGTLHSIRLKGFPLPGPLCGMVVWSKRLGFFKHEIGMHFDQTTPEVINQLTTIAGCGGIRRLLPTTWTSEGERKAA